MQYHGGKARLAPKLAPLIIERVRTATVYLEPFVGAASVFHRVAPHANRAIAADVHLDLMLMWMAATSGWTPPTGMTRQQYDEVRAMPDPSPLRAHVGFGCSFGGKAWGGYAGYGREYDYSGASSRGIVRKAGHMSGCELRCCDYTQHGDIERGWLIYADPPYAGTTGYAGCAPFDTDAFYKTCSHWADLGATVLVSESTPPPDGINYALVNEWQQRGTLVKDDNTSYRTEMLFEIGPTE